MESKMKSMIKNSMRKLYALDDKQWDEIEPIIESALEMVPGD